MSPSQPNLVLHEREDVAVLTTLGRIRRLVAEAAGVSAPPDPATVLSELVDLLPDWLTDHIRDGEDPGSVAFDVSLSDVQAELSLSDGEPEIDAVQEDVERVLESEAFEHSRTVYAVDTYDVWQREGVTLYVSVMGSYTRPRQSADQRHTGVMVVITAFNT